MGISKMLFIVLISTVEASSGEIVFSFCVLMVALSACMTREG